MISRELTGYKVLYIGPYIDLEGEESPAGRVESAIELIVIKRLEMRNGNGSGSIIKSSSC